jgi:GntR family transcriptional regulator, transcriptional repressor for pyruvate dehydrogenase complex
MRSKKLGTGSISANVTEHIVSLISEGKIRPGERLPSEYELMRQLNVGRSSVREAIRGLAMMGLVESKRRRGTIVISPISGHFGPRIDQSITYWAIRDLFDVRAVLEGHAAATAAQMASIEDLRAIDKTAREVERKIKSGSVYFDENARLHLSIAKASHNPVLLYCLETLIGSFKDVRMRFNENIPGMPERDIVEHRKIVDAIRARDANSARRQIQMHLNSYIKLLGDPPQIATDTNTPVKVAASAAPRAR